MIRSLPTKRFSQRRLAILFLAVFSVTVMVGPFAHAHVGESFGTSSLDHLSSHSTHAHSADHDHDHHNHKPHGHGDQSHTHEHNPADHSHEIPGFVIPIFNAQCAAPDMKYLVFKAQQMGRIAFNIDRPPRR